jgi:hypothetical protein
MFTHKIISKEFENGVLVLGVEFTDGVKVITEGVKPQDEAGFKFWLKSRLSSLNSLTELEKVNINEAVDVSEPAPVDTRTQDEKDRDIWITKYLKWVKIKATIIDTGIVPITNTKIANMLDDLKSTLLPEYIDYI